LCLEQLGSPLQQSMQQHTCVNVLAARSIITYLSLLLHCYLLNSGHAPACCCT
jgi:hypothetical protein